MNKNKQKFFEGNTDKNYYKKLSFLFSLFQCSGKTIVVCDFIIVNVTRLMSLYKNVLGWTKISIWAWARQEMK